MRKVPLWLFLLIIYINAVIIVLFGWSLLHIYQHGGKRLSPGLKNAIVFVARLPTELNIVYNYLFADHPIYQLATANDTIKSGLTFREKATNTSDGYLLVSAFDSLEKQSVVKLVQLSDGKMIRKWVPDASSLLKKHNPDNKKFYRVDLTNYTAIHPILMNNGDLVFNDFQSLVRVDKDSRLIWSNNEVYHHSVEQDADGNFWCSSVIEDSKLYKQFSSEFRDDAIAKVSASDGKTLFKKSVVQILLDNGYETLLLGIGPFEDDPVHLNDVQPALYDSKYWRKGDLLISLRHRSTVFLYRPETNKILWLKTGPWLNQHDCDFINDHQIGLFGNDITRNERFDFVNGYSNEFIYDFDNNEVTTPYTNLFKNGKLGTKSGGRSEILPNGDIHVEASDFGRIVIGDKEKIKMEYAERLTEKDISVLMWSRYMTAEEFSKIKF